MHILNSNDTLLLEHEASVQMPPPSPALRFLRLRVRRQRRAGIDGVSRRIDFEGSGRQRKRRLTPEQWQQRQGALQDISSGLRRPKQIQVALSRFPKCMNQNEDLSHCDALKKKPKEIAF